MTYQTQKRIFKTQEKVINVFLFPIKFTLTPIIKKCLKYKDNNRKVKCYTEKQIRHAIQFAFDYWQDKNDEIYLIDDTFSPVNRHDDDIQMLTPYHFYGSIWEYDKGSLRRFKNKLRKIYHNQQSEFLKILWETCPVMPMTEEEIKTEFAPWHHSRLKNKTIYKICKTTE